MRLKLHPCPLLSPQAEVGTVVSTMTTHEPAPKPILAVPADGATVPAPLPAAETAATNPEVTTLKKFIMSGTTTSTGYDIVENI